MRSKLVRVLLCLGMFQRAGFDPERVVEWCGNINYLQCVIPGPDQRSASFDADSLPPSASSSPNPIRGAIGLGGGDSSRLRPPSLNTALPNQQHSSSREHRGDASPRSVRRTFSNTTPNQPVTVVLPEPNKCEGAGGKTSGPDMHSVWEFPPEFRFDLDEKAMRVRCALPRGPPNRAPDEQVSVTYYDQLHSWYLISNPFVFVIWFINVLFRSQFKYVLFDYHFKVLVRPNIWMFGDRSFVSTRLDAQVERYNAFMKGLLESQEPFVIIEIGVSLHSNWYFLIQLEPHMRLQGMSKNTIVFSYTFEPQMKVCYE